MQKLTAMPPAVVVHDSQLARVRCRHRYKQIEVIGMPVGAMCLVSKRSKASSRMTVLPEPVGAEMTCTGVR